MKQLLNNYHNSLVGRILHRGVLSQSRVGSLASVASANNYAKFIMRQGRTKSAGGRVSQSTARIAKTL